MIWGSRLCLRKMPASLVTNRIAWEPVSALWLILNRSCACPNRVRPRSATTNKIDQRQLLKTPFSIFVTPLRGLNTPLFQQSHECPHPYVVIRSPPRRYNIPVYYRFTCLYPDASGRDDVGLHRMMYRSQSLPLDPQRYKGFRKNLRAVTDECHWLVGLEEMAHDVETTIINPQMLRAPASRYDKSGECRRIDLIQRGIWHDDEPRQLLKGIPGAIQAKRHVNDGSKRLLFGRSDGYIKAFFQHAEIGVIMMAGAGRLLDNHKNTSGMKHSLPCVNRRSFQHR